MATGDVVSIAGMTNPWHARSQVLHGVGPWRQPQTAALPGGSSAAGSLNDRLVGTNDDFSFQSPELEAAEDCKRQTDRWLGNESLAARIAFSSLSA
jgi:hypothetical protein